ncbi:YeeE/YedE family protein [Myxococcota bacterium]|nr:YeeE/YedE family protein [Myxococcota bacterium]MBU1432865.1 YeeE/YedE family protein [Myxococcota bacterium]MBU1898888.1 YeeE/YedE family protein [Myxococcota bacterium]
MLDIVIWAGWAGGLAVGAFLLLQLWLTGKLLGVSTGFGNLCALGSKAKFFHTGDFTDPFNWRLFFLLGLPLGGLLGVLLSPEATFSWTLSLGPRYDSVFPSALWARGLILTGAGFLVGYGARLAGGCTSGHAIAGISLLNLPSLLASVLFFVGGIAAVQLLFWLA